MTARLYGRSPGARTYDDRNTTMFTIDEIRIEGEEDGFHLIVHLDGSPVSPMRFKIGLPDQFHAEMERTIGRWLAEGEAASVPIGPAIDVLREAGRWPWTDDPDLARDIERGK